MLDALSHPVRLRLLQQVLNGTATTAELADDETLGTTGQLHHHLRALVAAGWLTSTGRGRWSIPAPRIIPLLVVVVGSHHPIGQPPSDRGTMTSTEVRTSEGSIARPIPRRRLRALLAIALVFGLVIGTLLGLTLGPQTPALGTPAPGTRSWPPTSARP